MDVSSTERLDIAQAIVGQLGEVGIEVELTQKELAVFNAPDQWTGAAEDASDLRLISWRPLFDPYTLLSLVVSNQGFLSRYNSETVQPLIDAFAVEPDVTKRAQVAVQLGKALFDDPAAIYLFDITSIFGVAEDAPAWTPRADDYIIPTVR